MKVAAAILVLVALNSASGFKSGSPACVVSKPKHGYEKETEGLAVSQVDPRTWQVTFEGKFKGIVINPSVSGEWINFDGKKYKTMMGNENIPCVTHRNPRKMKGVQMFTFKAAEGAKEQPTFNGFVVYNGLTYAKLEG